MSIKRSVLFHSDPFCSVAGRDLYEIAVQLDCQRSEVLAIIEKDGWFFCGYNDSGDECFVSPAEEAEARTRLGAPDTEWVVTLNFNYEHGLELDVYYFRGAVMAASREAVKAE